MGHGAGGARAPGHNISISGFLPATTHRAQAHPYELPLDVAIGDPVDFLSAGAYTGSIAAFAFNGFPSSRFTLRDR
jgi:hypothetical protein